MAKDKRVLGTFPSVRLSGWVGIVFSFAKKNRRQGINHPGSIFTFSILTRKMPLGNL
jgi:hypothetical protein